MATSRRRTAKKNLGQNLNDLDRRLKTVERRPRSGVDAWSITADMLAPGLITLDKLSPELLALLQQTYSSGDSTGDTTEEQGYGLTDALIASAEYSTTAANGKNSLFFSPTAPDEGTYLVDDIWYDTSLDKDGRPKYTPYQWDGDSWEPAPFGDASFRFLNAGKIATGTLDAAQIIRVGQYPTPEGKTRLEISGGNGIVTTTTTLVNAVTATSTTFIVSSATGMPSSGVFTIKVDYGLPTEELVTVTSRSGTTLTVVRGATDSIPFAHAAGAEVQYSSPVYAGITVLKNPVGSGITVTNEAGQASLPALFRLDASEGSLLIQEGDDYLKFNTSDSLGRLSISGQLLVGTGSESVAVGPNISGQQDGIRLGPYNWWYRPSSTLAEYPSGAIFFKVGSSDTGNLISAHTNGTVTIEGTVNPTAGVVKGKLSIRDIAGAVDRIEIGQNVLTNRDGIRIDANNHWTISNTGGSAAFSVGSATKNLTYDTVSGLLKLTGGDITLTGGGSFKTSDSNTRVEMNSNGVFGYVGGTKTFWIDAATGDSSFEGTTNPTGGTVKGKLTIQNTTYAFGKDVISTRDGLYLNGNNYWTLSQTGATAQFKAGGASKYVEWTGSELNISGNITASTFTGGTFQTATSGNRVTMVDAAADQVQFYSEFTDTLPANIKILTTFDGGLASKYFRTLTVQSTAMTPKVSTIQVGSGVATITTSTAHGFSVGESIKVMTGYSAVDGTYTVSQVVSSTQFRYAKTGTYPLTSVPNGYVRSNSVYAWMEPVNISLVTGYDATASSASKVVISAPLLYVYGTSTDGHATKIFGDLEVLGNLTVGGTGGGGGGTSYQAGNGIAIDTSTDPDTINNTGFRMNGTTSSASAARSSTQNRITFGTIDSTGTVPTGRSDGDLHIEY